MTPTSKKYLRMKLDEVEMENKDKIPDDDYKIFRDNILAEICSIELNDSNIRKAHNMEPIS
jgi:type III secretory pathway component EscU